MKILEERIKATKLLAEKRLYATGRIGFNTDQARTNGKITQAKNDLEIINELQQKNDLLQMDFNAAQEVMGCMNQEIEELKKQNKSWKEMVDSTNQTNQALCKRLDEGINEELIKALNYIRSCDNATQSAAKAIEMLKKYENV